MLKRLSATALLVLAAPTAQSLNAQAQDPQSAAWLRFVQQHGDSWAADWNKATGTPEAIWGPGLRVEDRPIASIARARAHATATLDRHAQLLGLGTSRFVERLATKQRHVYMFVYDQTFAGLPVIGGRADVRVHDAGLVSMFGSQAVPIAPGFSTTPALGAGQARALAYANRRVDPGPLPLALRPRGDVRLVVWADVRGDQPTTPRLAWEVDIDLRDGRLVVGRAYVDALTGAVLAFEDDVHECWNGRVHIRRRPAPPAAAASAPASPAGAPGAPRTDLIGMVFGWVNTGLRPYDATTNLLLPNVLVTAQGVGSAFTDQNGAFRIPYSGNNPVQLTAELVGRRVGSMSNASGTTLRETVSATPGVPVTIQFLSANANVDRYSMTSAYYLTDFVNTWTRGILQNTGPLDQGLDNVGITVNIPQSCNAYYTRNTINFYAASSQCFNTAYSTVVYHEWGHGLDDAYGRISRTDGLSEGWADVVAILASRQPIVGEDFFFDGRDVRTALNTLTYPQTGGVHTQGQTWMGYCWDVRTNLVASLGAQAAETLTNQLFIGSITVDNLDQPSAVREIFLLDDDDGDFTNGTPHYNELAQAAVKRRLPFPRVDFGTISHAPFGDTERQLSTRLVRATAVARFGTWRALELVYDIGGGETHRELVPSGNPNEHMGLLPGVVSPGSVSYRIEAEHSTGWIERLPENGEFHYRVGRETVHFFDDFESGPVGWTHGARVGVDDWQVGTPAGKNGTSNGISWWDPQGPFSGQNAWGNDLGNGSAGDYERGYDAWLRAPMLNLGGYTGVTLTYRRWLSVEDGRYDKAEIFVNGSPVWANPSLEHFGDNEWVEHSFAIPGADNNSNVQIEWSMQTDGSVELGGWNIDDVKVASFARIPLPRIQLRVLPAQVPLGARSAVVIDGTPNRPMAILISPNPGPTNIPGIPTLSVGPIIISATAYLDQRGHLAFSFYAPPANVTGALIYAQALELSLGNTVSVSNPQTIMFGR